MTRFLHAQPRLPADIVVSTGAGSQGPTGPTGPTGSGEHCHILTSRCQTVSAMLMCTVAGWCACQNCPQATHQASEGADCHCMPEALDFSSAGELQHVHAVNCSAQPVLLSAVDDCCGTSPAQCLSLTLFSSPPSGSCKATDVPDFFCRDSTGACGIIDWGACATADGACATLESNTPCQSETRFPSPGVCDGTGHCGESRFCVLVDPDSAQLHVRLFARLNEGCLNNIFWFLTPRLQFPQYLETRVLATAAWKGSF